MAFSAGELANIANAALDFYIKGDALAQSIQDKPLMDMLMKKSKTFPGGKGEISIPVKGDYTTALEGFAHNDTVSYANPANIKRAVASWYELHAGISLTLTELKHDGISVVDSNTSGEVTQHSQGELTRLTSLLDDKLDDMTQGWANTFNDMIWADGTQDAKEVPGIQALITSTATSGIAPATGTIHGLNRATFDWWRNRSATLAAKKTSAATNGGVLLQFLQNEIRQLRRYGGRPDIAVCGSDFMNALETELRANGNYTQTGFSGAQDVGVGAVKFAGLTFVYDPTMDGLNINSVGAGSGSKYCYILDSKHIKLYVMDGEDLKQHTPSRPADQYVMYRAVTWTGGLMCDQLNCHGVYSIA
tara:strand:+ start:5952 stop:7034 length:1083 start_codon:yes stop_codon:yes gene_type:complete